MSLFRPDPGECPICGQAHTACTATSGRIAIPQLPARDATELETPPLVSEAQTPPLVAEIVQAGLPPGSFTTGTYKRKKRG